MTDILAPLLPDYSLQIPEQPGVWVVWVAWLVISGFLSIKLNKEKFNLNRRNLVWFAALSLSILIVTPFFGVALGSGSFDYAESLPFNHLMFLAAVPWMLAGGILGVFPAAMLAGTSGLLLAYLDTHHIFTPLIFLSISLLYGWSIRQTYQTTVFKLLRSPLIASIFSLITAIPLILLAQVLTIEGTLAARLAIAFNSFPAVFIALGGMMLIGGIINSIIKRICGAAWGSKLDLKPSPLEANMIVRWLAALIPLLLLASIIATFSTWSLAEKKARETIVAQMTTTSRLISNEAVSFIDRGHSLMAVASTDPRLINTPSDTLANIFEDQQSLLSFFDRIVLLNSSGQLLKTYPSGSEGDFQVTDLNFQSINAPSYQRLDVVPGDANSDNRGVIQFLSPIYSSTGQINGWLVGEVDVTSNLLQVELQQIIDTSIITKMEVKLIAGDGLILFPSIPGQSIAYYTDEKFTTPSFSEQTDQDGKALINYFQPISDTDWSVLTSMPEILVSQIAWKQAAPVLFVGIATIFIVVFVLLLLWSPIRKNILQWTSELDEESFLNGTLNLPKSNLYGEIGKLSTTFERMLASLQSRLENQSDLFTVNKEIAGKLDMKDSLEIIMKAALVHNVSSVRIVLSDSTGNVMKKSGLDRFGMGKHANLLADLDDDVCAQVQKQGEVILEDFRFGKTFDLSRGMPYPASMIAMPLKDESSLLGTLWVTYQDLRSPSSEDLAFFKALAQKTSRIIMTNEMFNQSSMLKMQFENALDKIPDALYLVDEEGKVIYHNPSAARLLAAIGLDLEENSFEKIFTRAGITSASMNKIKGPVSEEVLLEDGNIYRLIANPLNFENQQNGWMIIIRDITQEKEKALKKSEYVMTVSHELRSPLTLIQGYAKILRLTGNLNDQQSDYINNIIDGAEEMKSLVQNLLDIGRLEGGEPLDITPILVGELVQKVVDGMNAQAKQRNIQLQTKLPQDPIMIEADTTFLTQALKNLVDNGIKFTKMGGEVVLSVIDEEQAVTFVVRDNGSGISPLDQRHVFEKFHSKTITPEGKQKGSGLGLAIVRSIAEHHGGKVWFESQLGKGSTFYLKIPKTSIRN